MKHFVLTILLLLAATAFAQTPKATPHQVTLTWNASTTAGVKYDVYRSTGAGSTNFVKIAPLVNALTYVDSNVTSGQIYNYSLTAVDPVTGNQSDGTAPVAASPIPTNPNSPGQVTAAVQ